VKKQLLVLLIVAMSIAMAVFIGIQVYWIKSSLQLRETNFKRNVDDAVNAALTTLETIEYANRANVAGSQGLKSDTGLNINQLPLQLEGFDPDSHGIKMPIKLSSETATIAMPGTPLSGLLMACRAGCHQASVPICRMALPNASRL